LSAATWSDPDVAVGPIGSLRRGSRATAAARREAGLRWLLRGATYGMLAVIGWILLDIFGKGLPVITWRFLTDLPRASGAEGGILPAIAGTCCLVAGAFALALPLGVASAIYLHEYAAPSRFVAWTRLAISTLAGLPSIVFGLFGLGLFVLFLQFGASILSGCLTLACMMLPTIIVGSEEALRSVPSFLRHGSLALGATPWQTIRYNVLPYALPHMVAGALLGVARAAGETAPILFTAAAFYIPRLPRSILEQVMTLPYHLFALTTQHPEAARIRPMQYGTAVVLLTLVLGLGLIGIVLRNYFRKKLRW
jgi:phosphate transport system permease protein